MTGEVCPHHIALTDSAVEKFDTNCKMNPPLRSAEDVDALLEGIADGTISILASDHAPHASFEKEVEFDMAPFGIVGLETELGLFLDVLIHKHHTIDLWRLIEMYTVEPARLLKLEAGTLSTGASADADRRNRHVASRPASAIARQSGRRAGAAVGFHCRRRASSPDRQAQAVPHGQADADQPDLP